MIFYKKRNLSELISDSIEFFKEYGKNFLKNYIALCGGVIILMLVIAFFLLKDFSSSALGGGLQNSLYSYLYENASILGFSFFLIFALLFLLSCISYSLPILYMQTASEQNRKDFSVQEIFNVFKNKLGRIIAYFLWSILLSIPVIIVLFIVFGMIVSPFLGIANIGRNSLAGFIFLFLIIFLLAIVFIVSISLIFTLSFNNYILTNMGFFPSLGKAFSIVFSKNFKKYFFSVIISYLIIFAIQLAVNSVLGGVMAISVFSGASQDQLDSDSTNVILVAFTVLSYVVIFITNLILSNLLYINIGFIYYDSREDLHREVFFDEIDSIGSNV